MDLTFVYLLLPCLLVAYSEQGELIILQNYVKPMFVFIAHLSMCAPSGIRIPKTTNIACGHSYIQTDMLLHNLKFLMNRHEYD